jgi:lipopolysaccharide export system protein LptA
MRWQQKARLLIAIFVIAFAAVVFLAMRKRAAVTHPASSVPEKPVDAVSASGAGFISSYKDGKVEFTVRFKRQSTYKNGRSVLEGVTLLLPDRNGRTVTVTADEAEVIAPPENPKVLSTAKLTRNVKLTTDNGIVVTSSEATYDDKEGILKVPGAVEFTRGRMKGTGVGATYDKARDILWLLDQARITVAPDEKGEGGAEASASTAGLARAENYIRLSKAARIVAEGRTAEAAEIVGLLDEKGEKIQQLQLRNQSRIVSTGPSGQTMSARDIDMTYAADGRTLQSSKLMENGVVELPGSGGAPARRIAGRNIDIAMSPDGKTVTNLTATEKVQVDLPADAGSPAKQIRSNTLRSTGAADQGLQNAVFEGSVEYEETRPAAGKQPAVKREVRAMRLIVDTKPGLGAVDRADFHGRVHFTDGRSDADAPRAVYYPERDLIELSPGEGDTGPGPLVNDRQLAVEARTIQLSPTSQKLTAETDVRSVIQPQRAKPAPGGGRGAGSTPADQTRVPAMLKQDKPVTVTSNRLAYDGVSEATYSGSAVLWQDKSRISGDTIVLDNRSGNLTARGTVRTTMWLDDVNPETKQRTPTETKATADQMVYDDSKRLATYTATGTTPARLVSAQGDLTGDRIDLFLKEGGSELERAEADGKVVFKDAQRNATGSHMVYTAATDTYVMTGQPVELVQRDEKKQCSKTLCRTLTFQRSVDSIQIDGMVGLLPQKSTTIPCPADWRN